MSMNISVNQANMFFGVSRMGQRANVNGSGWMYPQNGRSAQQTACDARRMLARDRLGQDADDPYAVSSGGVTERGFSYTESIRNAREKARETSLCLKKLHYDFKSISTQILRSKTSFNARQVAGKARREVIRLKRQRQSGEYDEEELKSAIVHAQAMERVAKKKMQHLLEEEMAKVTGGPCAGELEEREQPEDESAEEALKSTEEPVSAGDDVLSEPRDAMTEAMREQMQAYQDMMREQMEMLQEQAGFSVEDMMSELMSEMADSMKELLEESGLSELTESLFTAEVEMDPADLKLMKLKHRSEELRDIAKADAEYLKAVFDRLEKAKDSAMKGIGGSNGDSASFGGIPAGGSVLSLSGGSSAAPSGSMPGIDIVSAPDASSAVSAEVSGGFDVSV